MSFFNESVIEVLKNNEKGFDDVRKVLKDGYTVFNKKGKTYAHFAAEYGRKSVLETIIYLEEQNNRLEYSNTKETSDCSKKNEKTTHILSEKDDDGLTPLYYAAINKHEDCVKLLLEKDKNYGFELLNNIESVELLENIEDGSFDALKEQYANEGQTYIVTIPVRDRVRRYLIYRPCKKLSKKIEDIYSLKKKNHFLAPLAYNFDDCGYAIEYFPAEKELPEISPYLLLNELNCLFKYGDINFDDKDDYDDCFKYCTINASNIYSKKIKAKIDDKEFDTVLFTVGDLFLTSVERMDESCKNYYECAPEVLLAENLEERLEKNKTKKAKWWSIGCILYKYISGKLFLNEERKNYKSCNEWGNFLKKCDIPSVIDKLECEESYKELIKYLMGFVNELDTSKVKTRFNKSKDSSKNICKSLKELPLSFREKYNNLHFLENCGEGGKGKVTLFNSGDGGVYCLKVRKELSKTSITKEKEYLKASNQAPFVDGSFHFEHQPWLLYSYIDGETLSYSSSKLDKVTKYIVMYGVAYVFSILSKNILHRDLTENNIIIDRFGEPHVIDFGEGKMYQSDAHSISRTNSLKGTEGYIPPEGCNHYTEKYDVYGYGATFDDCFKCYKKTMGSGIKEMIEKCIEKKSSASDADIEDLITSRPSFDEILYILENEIKKDRDITNDDLIKFFAYKEKIVSINN